MDILVIQGDITTLELDAIVNAANHTLLGGGGVDGAIHRKGGPAILEACREIGGCETGQAVRTTGGKLPIKHLIHTVGPVYREKEAEEADRLLASAYRHSLELADELECRTIGFPNISTGIYGFPKKRALQVVASVLEKSTNFHHLEKLVFCCFDDENYQLYLEKFTK